MRTPLIVLVLLLSWLTAPARAQDGESVAAEDVQQLLDGLPDAGLDEALAATLDELYRDASRHLEQAAAFDAEADAFTADTASAPERLNEVRAALADTAEPSAPNPSSDADAAALEALRAEAAAAVDGARGELTRVDEILEGRARRRTAIPIRQSAIREMLAAAPARPAADEHTRVTAARGLVREAEHVALRAEQNRMTAELALYDAEREVIRGQRDLSARRVTQLEATEQAWQTLVDARRALESQSEADAARQAVERAAAVDASLRPFAEATAALAERMVGEEGVAVLHREATAELRRLRRETDDLRDDDRKIRRRVDLAGLNPATGVLIRQRYETLESPAALERHHRAGHAELAQGQLQLIEIEELVDGAGDVHAVARTLVEAAGRDTQAIRAMALELATARRDVVIDALAKTEAYVDTLAQRDEVLIECSTLTAEVRTYIEERILWIRSVQDEGGPSIDATRDALHGLFGADALSSAATAVGDAVERAPVVVIASLIVYGIVIIVVWIARRRLRRSAERVRAAATDRLILTWEALALSIVCAAPIPALLWLAGRLLRVPLEQDAVMLAWAHGFNVAAHRALPLMLLIAVLRRDGLGEVHFAWPPDAVAAARRTVIALAAVLVPVAFVTAATDAASPAWHDSLGRVAFMIGALALAAALGRIIRPAGVVLRQHYTAQPTAWSSRLRYVWWLLAVSVSLALVALSWLGYAFTASSIEDRLILSLKLAAVLMIAASLLERWLRVARRRLVEEARRRSAEPSSEAAEAVEAAAVDIPEISEHTRKLFRTVITVTAVVGLYLIWANALPALKMLDRVQVFPSIAVLDEGAAPPPPVEVTPDEQQVEDEPQPLSLPTAPSLSTATPGVDADGATSITLADVGLAILIFLATALAVRSLPAMIEIILLQRLPLDPGARYALATVVRYVIAIVGLVAGFGALGITWAKLQWLAAALTFGLAFGLQEIFANFVSGLILLFERPIRIGDTVTVNGKIGTVTRIRMRATTIFDWDGRELVLPNKDFITGEVYNWTLSRKTARWRIRVGVAYSSDADYVQKRLLEITRAQPGVLHDPPPEAFLFWFGESTLDFELRFFYEDITKLNPAIDMVNRAIVREFRKDGIEIAFPQRDLHIRSGLDELIEQNRKKDMEEGAS